MRGRGVWDGQSHANVIKWQSLSINALLKDNLNPTNSGLQSLYDDSFPSKEKKKRKNLHSPSVTDETNTQTDWSLLPLIYRGNAKNHRNENSKMPM